MPQVLAQILFWVCAAACAVSQGALILGAIRRHERAAAPRTRELVWVAVPAAGLALLLGATWAALSI